MHAQAVRSVGGPGPVQRQHAAVRSVPGMGEEPDRRIEEPGRREQRRTAVRLDERGRRGRTGLRAARSGTVQARSENTAIGEEADHVDQGDRQGDQQHEEREAGQAAGDEQEEMEGGADRVEESVAGERAKIPKELACAEGDVR